MALMDNKFRVGMFILLLATGAGLARAQTSPPAMAMSPARFYPETVLVKNGAPAAMIVASDSDPAAQAAARQTAQGLKDRYGIDFPIVPDSAVCSSRLAPVGEAYRTNTLIVVGNLYNNRVFFPLYIEFLAGADSRYPGGDGHEVRSVCNPWGAGANVLVIGASSAAGLQAGVKAWLARLPPRPDADVLFPYTIDIQFGPEINPPDPDKIRRPIDTNAWYDVNPFAEAASNYYWTGDERWARRARAFMLYHNARFSSTRYPMGDYDMERFYRAWDQVEESPVFTDAERRTSAWHFVETALNWTQFATGATLNLGGTHTTLPAMAGIVASRWIQRTYPDNAQLLKISGKWAGDADDYFKSAVYHFRDDSDTISYSTISSIALFMRWSAANNFAAYYREGLSRVGLQLALSTTDSMGYYAGLDTYGAARMGAMYMKMAISYQLQICAFMHSDPYLRWLAEQIRPEDYSLYGQILFPYNTCTFPLPPDAPRANTGYLDNLTLASLSAGRHKMLSSTPNTFLPPLEQCFDKATFRSGMHSNDAYLLLNGIAHAGDANTIPRYTDQGQIWLNHNTSQIGPYYRNALYLSNGRNDEIPAAVSRLDMAARFDDYAVITSTLTNYYGADWQRTIVWRKGQWFLVMDRALIRKEDQYSAQSIWRLPAGGQWDGQRELTVNQGARTLHLISGEGVQASAAFESPAGGPPDIYENPFFLRERKSGKYRPGDVIDFMNLLVVTSNGAPAPARPVRQDDASVAVLNSDGTRTLVLIGGGAGQPSGIQADQGVVIVESNAIHVAGAAKIHIGGKAVLDRKEPMTARLDLTDGAQVSGHDADALKSAAYTWQLPACRREAWEKPDEAQKVAGLVVQRLNALKEAGESEKTVLTVPVGKEQGRWFVKRWESSALTQEGRRIFPSRVVCRPEGIAAGREGCLSDGIIPVESNYVGWPAGATADVELAWGNVVPLGEIRLYMNRDLFGKAREPATNITVEVQWMTGQGTGAPLFQMTSMEVKTTALPVGKTKCELQRVGIIPCNGISARGVRVRIPPAPFFRPYRGKGTIITEIELRGNEPGPLAVRHLQSADLDGDGKNEHLVSAGSGELVCLNPDGRLRWKQNFAAEVSGLDVGDLDGDGRQEVLCCSYDLYAYAFSADGRCLWKTDFCDLFKRSHERFGSGFYEGVDGSTPFSIGFWRPAPDVRRVLVGSYETQLFLLDASGSIVQQYYPGFSMFQRTFVSGAMDVNGDGKDEKMMCSMKYGAQGLLHILGYNTNGIAWHKNIPLPDNLPYAVRIHREKNWQAGVITPVGVGCYNIDGALKSDAVNGSDAAIWERKGRPLSAGTIYLEPVTQSMRFLVAGFDNMIAHYDASGRCLGIFQSDKAVRDMAVVWVHQTPVLILATDGGLRAYDVNWNLLDVMPGACARVAAINETSPAVLAVTDEGLIQCIGIKESFIDRMMKVIRPFFGRP